MRVSRGWRDDSRVVFLVCLVTVLILHTDAVAATPPGRAIVAQLQDEFGFSEGQVRGALGALLVFARDRLPKPDFDDLAKRIPNADDIMQEVKLHGIVNGPLDDLDDYEATLSNLGIGPQLAAQFAPAVVKYLGAAGYYRERDILQRVID